MANQVAAVTKYLLLSLFVVCSYMMGLYGGVGRSPILFVICYMIAFIIMLSLWNFVKIKIGFKEIIITAVLARLLMLPYPAGDDIHRYIWEGEIQNAGFNPFELAPNSEELKHLRNENWKGINHKNISTIYWPTAQLLFRCIAFISPTKIAFKFTMMLFDIGVLLLLFLLIKLINSEPRNIILYALNPYTIHWFAGEGHLESVVVFVLILSLVLYQKQKWALMFISLSMSILIKLTPFFIVPFLIKKDNLKYLPLMLLPVLLFIPFLNDKVSPFVVPCLFTEDFTYNGLLNNILRLFYSKPVTLAISIVIAGMLYVIVFLTNFNWLRSTFLAFCIFILCSPTFHPWYLLIITPFIVIYNSPAWITLHLTVVVKSFFWINAVQGDFWHNDDLLLLIEYIPFLTIAFFTFVFNLTKFPFNYRSVNSISVIIPTFNEEQNIGPCLNAISVQERVKEILVTDCGSRDNTVILAKSYDKVKIIEAEKGRGNQIADAYKEANGDVVVIVHADSVLIKDAFKRMLLFMNKHSDISGGAFGAYYSDHRFPLLLPKLLNVFRASVLGISFGDQAQFFRKDAIKEFPRFMLMEDIELSLRMKQNGKTLFIPKGVVSSSRMWSKSGYFSNFIKVIYLTSLFLFKRRLGFLSKDCREFYKVYYGK